jgi:type I restriction enzyme, S subunit
MTWTTTRIDRVATVNARIGWKALTASEYQPEGYVFLATPNIKPESIDFEGVNYISEYRYEESPELKLRPGDVLLAKDGNTLGITNIVRELPRQATVNGSIAVLRAFDVEPRFLRYSLASGITQDLIESIKGGMGVPHLFQWDIKRLPIMLPALEEQRRIADFLDAETVRIDKATAVIARQQQVLDDRYQAAVDAEIDRTNELIPLKYVAIIVDTEHKTAPAVVGGGYWIAGTASVHRGRIDKGALYETDLASFREWTKRRRPRAGDVMLSREAPVGEVGLYRPEDAHIAIGQRMVLMSPQPKRLSSEYLAWTLLSSRTKKFIDDVTQGSLHPHLNMSDIGSIRVGNISLPEQEAVVHRLASAIGEFETLNELRRAQLSLLSERRQALMTAAVTGQIDVTTAGGVAV